MDDLHNLLANVSKVTFFKQKMANNGKCEDYIYVITLIAPDKREYQDIFFLFLQKKCMLWVLIKSAS